MGFHLKWLINWLNLPCVTVIQNNVSEKITSPPIWPSAPPYNTRLSNSSFLKAITTPTSDNSHTAQYWAGLSVFNTVYPTCLHAYIHAGLLANRLTSQGCGGLSFLHTYVWLLPCRGRRRVDITHYQVYILLIVWGFFDLTTLLKRGWGLTFTMEQVWEVVLLNGDDPLEVAPFLSCPCGLAQWVGQILPSLLLLILTADKEWHLSAN